jgi:hypothetical protein
MTKEIRAYFKSEDDLLSAEASLKKLHIHDVRLDEITNSEDFYTIFPNFTGIQSSTNAGLSIAGILENSSSEENTIHVLEGNIVENEYQKAVEIIRENDGSLQN